MMSDGEARIPLLKPTWAVIEDHQISLTPKVFSTGSVGWHGQAKVMIDGQRCQVNIIVTVIGSKTAHAAALDGEQKDMARETAQDAPKRPRRAKKADRATEAFFKPLEG